MAAARLEAVAARQWAALLVGVAALSWAAPLIRLAEAPSLTVAALRPAAAALPLLAAAAIWRRRELLALRPREAAPLALGGLALAAHFAFWVAAVQQTSVVASTAMMTTQPLFAGLGAWLALGERLTRPLLLGVAISALGALLLAGADYGEGASLRGDLFAALGAAFAGVYFVAGRQARARVSNLGYAAAVNAVAAAALLIALAASGGSPAGHGTRAYACIALLALVPQLIGHGSLTWALGTLPAVVVAVAVLGEPVGATAIGAAILGERPEPAELLGAAVLLAGVFVALRGRLGVRRGGGAGAR